MRIVDESKQSTDLNEEYTQRIAFAQEQKTEIERVFSKLKKKKPKDLDAHFHKAHDKAFSKIDCLSCANCCKTTSPIFRDIDIKRISKRLKIGEAEFSRTYLKMDEDRDWVLQKAPCAFLGADHLCSIYEYRPQACKDYPHTDRKKIVQVLDLTLKNISICPAVAEVSTEVIKVYP